MIALADTDNDGTLSEEELTALTKAKLLALASELGYEGITSSMTKAEIIAAILEAQAAGTDDDAQAGG
jgi:hypothetical protein